MKRRPTALIIACGLTAAGCAGPQGAVAPTGATPAVAAASTPAPPPRALTVFAAASLTAPFGEIGRAFEAAHPGVDVAFNFAGSQQLATQIVEGAPADVFASAHPRPIDAVVAAGAADAAAVRTFARNRLVIAVPADNPAGVHDLGDLAAPGLALVLAAPGVPAGGYALDVVARAAADPRYTTAFSATVRSNVVSYEDDVKAVLAKVRLGEVDAGVVYASDVVGVDDITAVAIPDGLNVVARYPIVPLAAAAAGDLAAAFVAAVLAPDGQAVLARHGFMRAGP